MYECEECGTKCTDRFSFNGMILCDGCMSRQMGAVISRG